MYVCYVTQNNDTDTHDTYWGLNGLALFYAQFVKLVEVVFLFCNREHIREVNTRIRSHTTSQSWVLNCGLYEWSIEAPSNYTPHLVLWVIRRVPWLLSFRINNTRSATVPAERSPCAARSYLSVSNTYISEPSSLNHSLEKSSPEDFVFRKLYLKWIITKP